jgi:cell division protein FtsI/penicillin-binding protein 2
VVAAPKKARRLNPVKIRIALIGLAILAAWGAMGYRLVQVQVVQAAELADQGLSQRLVTRDLPPQRGKIYDRNGELLALTVEATTLYAVPGQVEEPLWVAQQIGGLLDVDPDVLYDRLTSDKDFVYMKRQVEPVLADEILGMGIRGINPLPEPTRVYPAGVVASHVTGFVDIDGNGQEGLEYIYDEELRGVPGSAVFERDLVGRPIPQGTNDIIPAVPGIDLNTTIDLPLQYNTQEACNAAIERTGAKSCWVVVLHVETGEILAMTGAPDFDPVTRQTNDPACEEAEEPGICRSFSNFAVRGMYEPGSTQKLITFAAAIEEGEVGVGTVIPQVTDVLELREDACRSADDETFGCYRDFKEHVTEDMTVSEIFTRSSNVGSILVAEKLGQPRLIEYIKAFGLGETTGVDFAAESPGYLNFEAGCETCWASAAIGYSVAATPLQMAAAYAAIGNDGVWTTPHIVATKTDVDGNTEVAGVASHPVVSEGTALLMRQLLARVVEEGTGQAAQVRGYRVGGKTGTANKLLDGRYTDVTRASFVGLAPINDPKIVVAVLVDEPSPDFRTGGQAAAPVFAEVMKQALHRLGVTPDAENE